MQLKYREMLDQQLQQKNQFKMYGNMSSVEKALNKNDLNAYKNFDNKNYSLVPGLQHYKYSIEATPKKSGTLSPGQDERPYQKSTMSMDNKYLRKFEELNKLGYHDSKESFTSPSKPLMKQRHAFNTN